MTLLAAAAEPGHGTHLLHLLEATAFVVVALAAVAIGEHLKERRPPIRLLVVALAGAASAAIHLGVAPSHWEQAPVYGLFFVVAGTAQLGYSLLLLVRPLRALLVLNVAGNLGLLLLWAQTRTAGVPIGPAAGIREGVGPLDLTSAVLELVVVAVAITLVTAQLRTTATPSRRSASSPARPTGCRP